MAEVLGRAVVKYPAGPWEQASGNLRPAETLVQEWDYVQQGYVDGLDHLNLKMAEVLAASPKSKRFDRRDFEKLVHEVALRFWYLEAEALQADAKGFEKRWGAVRDGWLRDLTTTHMDLAPELSKVLQGAVPRDAWRRSPKDWFPRDMWYWFVLTCRSGGAAPSGAKSARDFKGDPIFFDKEAGRCGVTSLVDNWDLPPGMRVTGLYRRGIWWSHGRLSFHN